MASKQLNGDEDPDRLLIQASELRRIAEGLEARARSLRSGRRSLPSSTFDMLWNRDLILDPLSDTYFAYCTYCGVSVHGWDGSHRIKPHPETPDAYVCHFEWDGRYWPLEGRCAEVDHVVPVAQGGTNDPDNLVLACTTCNRKKGARTAAQWKADEFIAAHEPVVLAASYVTTATLNESIRIIRSLRSGDTTPCPLIWNGEWMIDLGGVVGREG